MLYFLSNSLAVVAAAAVVFFILGLWFGALTWGRYKRRARAFQEETSLLRHEIATLKRRIAEEAVEPSRPVSIIDEGPSVELQPLLFQLSPPAPEPEQTLPPAPAEVKQDDPVPPPPASITTIIAKSKSSVAVPAPVPDSIGRDAVSPDPVVPPAPVLVAAANFPTLSPVKDPAPAQVQAPPSLPVPVPAPAQPEPPAPPKAPEAGPVVSLVQPGSVTALPFPPLLPVATSAEVSATSQMNASFQASHDAGLPEFPALPGLDSGAMTLSSSSTPAPATPTPATPTPAAPVSMPLPVPVVPVSIAVPTAPPAPAVEMVSAPAPALQPTPTAMPPVPEAPPTNWFARELDAGLGKVDPLVGFCYQQRPERWDDLTLLRGLGEGIQERLHAIGIFTFKQIGLWTEAQSLETGTRIQARERLQRERWVQQAKDLHFLKYGERLLV